MTDRAVYSRQGDIGVITIHNPPVNAIGRGVPEAILEALAQARQDPQVVAVVLHGAGRTFSAGADIHEFGQMTSGQIEPRSLLPFLEALENSPQPIVMAIHGTALGAGLEIALAGHYRVAAPGAQLGLPEVKIGLIPGAAGTQRLPRLVGIAKALDMCVSGDPISAADALACGLVDRVIEGDLVTGACAFAREVAALPPPRTRERTALLRGADPGLFPQARQQTARRARGLEACGKAIDAVEAAVTMEFGAGCQREAELFRECLFSAQSKALIHVFFGEREAARPPEVPLDAPVLPVARVAVVGAGTMGTGIAMAYANAGLPVLLKDESPEALERGINAIHHGYAAEVRKGRLTPEAAAQRAALITPVRTYDGFADVDLVVEAVFEQTSLKQAVFAELDQATRPEAILASNTSTLDIDALAAKTKRPDRVVGHHFFSPAHRMRLLEIVRGKETSGAVLANSLALAKKLRKVGVVVGNAHGFVGNRMYAAYTREAVFLAEEGTPPEEVDAALVEFGMAMGPLAVDDLAGLDVGWRVREEMRRWEQPGVRYPRFEDLLVQRGRHGQKTGAGWYRYDEQRRPAPDQEVNAWLRTYAQEAGIAPHHAAPEEVRQRTLYALINEGAKLLEEGVARRPVDIDLIYIHGYGFPAYRGGPMWYADEVGLGAIHDRIAAWHRSGLPHWEPAPLLARLASTGSTFAAWDQERQPRAARV